MFEPLLRLLVAEEGSDATEYALLAALIAIAIVVGAQSMSTKVGGLYNTISTTLSSVI